jgi:hypothetical protein
MTDKSLQDKAIKVKGGKEYVQVVDRVNYFNENYPNGSIKTDLVQVLQPDTDNPIFIVKATVETGWTEPDKDGESFASQTFTGLSQAKLGSKGANLEAALENAETSAVGRALGFMGIGVIDSIASADELKKAGVDFDAVDAFRK